MLRPAVAARNGDRAGTSGLDIERPGLSATENLIVARCLPCPPPSTTVGDALSRALNGLGEMQRTAAQAGANGRAGSGVTRPNLIQACEIPDQTSPFHRISNGS